MKEGWSCVFEDRGRNNGYVFSSGGNVGLNMTVTADAVSCQRRRGSNLERALAGNDLGADEDEEDEDAKA